MIISGIYKIKNKLNNKVYIGSAINIGKRWRDHRWYLRHNKHHNSHLQSSWNKYGEDVFEFIILIKCGIDKLLVFEKNYIVEYDAQNNKYGYNVNDPEHKFLNKKHSEKTKKILSEQKMGAKNPMFGKFGDKHPNFNKPVSAETKNKQSLSHIGIPTNRRTHSKLTETDIINIRKMYYEEKISQPKIAVKYGVSYTAINHIFSGKAWSNVK